jgi:hypothetical protein
MPKTDAVSSNSIIEAKLDECAAAVEAVVDGHVLAFYCSIMRGV